MVERPGEHGNSSAELGRQSQRQSGCPVQHSPSDDASVATTADSSDLSAAVASAAVAVDGASGATGGGLWSSLASWIPFRGGTAGKAHVFQQQPGGGLQQGGRELLANNEGGDTAQGCPVVARPHNRSTRGDCPRIAPDGAGEETASSGCPVSHGSPAAGGTAGGGGGGGGGGATGVENYNALNNEYVYGQEVSPGQAMPLSTSRQRSSIPKAELNPSHQPKGSAETWVYPSEQQYYNAIRRKGYKASATDIPTTLAIHNAVNEKGWEMVKEWERLHGGGGADGNGDGARARPPPKLLRFSGRPQDTSPKAWIKSNLLGYHPPFDRHDWVVSRADGTEARYVIDFYAGKIAPGSNMPVAMHLDVRPALDSVDAVVDRTRMLYGKEVRPYFASVLDAFKRGTGSDPKDSTPDAPPPSAGR